MKRVVTYGLYNNEKNIKDFEKQVQKVIENHREWKVEKNFIDYTKNKQYISFGKLLNEILKGNIDIVLIKNVRQFYQVMGYAVEFFINFLKQIEVIFLDEEISTADAIGRTQIQIMVFMIQSEDEMRSKVRRGHLSRSYNRKKRI